MARRPTARLRVINPDEKISASPVSGEIDQEDNTSTDTDGTQVTVNEDGSVDIKWGGAIKKPRKDNKFGDNLSNYLEDDELSRIASDLSTGIENDDRSRKEWLETRARGMTLLGLKLEDPRGDVGASSAPLEGMSTVRHPLLLDSCLRFQANARGELLPATGPVKVRNDTPPAPNNIPDEFINLQTNEDLATALEADFNHYLTVEATEYYPDTDRMLFQVGFGGLGIKKVYNCPLRQRPVSESVDAKDLIVSNAATTLADCGRVTHRIMMRPSVMKRMQLIGAYRDVDIKPTTPTIPNEVDQKIANIQGVKPQLYAIRPEDSDQEFYECYCELDVPGFEHRDDKGKETGLRVPYKVVLHKDSRTIVDIRRNWKEGDKLCLAKEYFVDYPFVSAFGFYPIGFVHILGNTTATLTAAWREMLDAGMFSNFPGFLYTKLAGRQLTNQFRVPPGGGVALDTGDRPIRDAVMPLPYKEPGPSLTQFITHVEEIGQRIGQTAEMNIGEGKQDVPVGTTLALIEQATKVIDSVHKRLHEAQSKEFRLLKERFKENPQAFWRNNKRATRQWDVQTFLSALDNANIVPVADPNNPTSLHRIAKATAVKQLQMMSPELYDSAAVDKRIMRIVGIDPEGLFNKGGPAPPPPDPRIMAVQAKQQSDQISNAIAAKKLQIDQAKAQQDSLDSAQERASKERVTQMEIEMQQLKLQQEQQIHEADMARAAVEFQRDQQMEVQKHQLKMHMDQQSMQMDQQNKEMQMQHDAKMRQQELDQNAHFGQIEQKNKLEQASMAHQQKLEQGAEMHKQKLTQMKQQKAAMPKPAAKPTSNGQT